MTVDQLTMSGPAAGDRRPARGSTRNRWISAGLALAVIGALVLVALTRGPDNVGTAREIKSAVEVKSGGGRFQPVAEHPAVKKGDIVRTDDKGLGTIDYGDGSVTRLDSNTVFEVDELLTSGRRVVRASLSEGRVWNKVKKLTSSGDRFEVRTPNAVATVRGTTFTCETDPLGLGLVDTTCIQVTGRTDVVFDNGAQSQLGPGECTTNGGPCKYTPAEILKILSKFANLDGIELPWTKDEPSDSTTAEDLTSTTTNPRGVIDDNGTSAGEGLGRSLPSGRDDEDNEQGENEPSSPRRDTTPTDSDGGLGEDDGADNDGDQDDGGDSGGDGGGEDPGEDEGEEVPEEDDGNSGCGDGEGGGRGGGCPHNDD